MQFGVRKADAPEQSGNYLRNFQKGETLVRFLAEVDDWQLFHEHFNAQGRSFPCTNDKDTCPGCTSSNEKMRERKRKYAALLWNVKKDVVLPYRIPVSLSDRMSARSERNGGTILSRDFVVLKSGSGMDTEYDVDQEDKYPVDIAEKIKAAKCTIQQAWEDAFAENAPDNALLEGKRKATNAEEMTQTKKDDDLPPSEPQTGSDAGAEENLDLTEKQVREMSKPALQALCDKAGLVYDSEDTRSELADKLIASFGQ
jgi:hypothetical protein